MKKVHLSDDGTYKPCEAEKDRCPYKEHIVGTQKEIQKAIEEKALKQKSSIRVKVALDKLRIKSDSIEDAQELEKILKDRKNLEILDKAERVYLFLHSTSTEDEEPLIVNKNLMENSFQRISRSMKREEVYKNYEEDEDDFKTLEKLVALGTAKYLKPRLSKEELKKLSQEIKETKGDRGRKLEVLRKQIISISEACELSL